MLFILGIFCSATSYCPSSWLSCGGEPVCVPENLFCDGQNNCRDGSDEATELCANRECRGGSVRCEGASPTRVCVSNHMLCDGNNDCGNNWDEDLEVCAAIPCPDRTFACPRNVLNVRCIPDYFLCNGDVDCGDGSDESADTCGNRSCPWSRGLVKCEGLSPTVWCIGEELFCDGVDNCGNNWDENPANCVGRRCSRVHEGVLYSPRRCLNTGVCINAAYFCNGYNDCGDLSDENATGCPAPTCSPGFIPCPSGLRRCISEDWLCDGSDDCGDGSDEDIETCLDNGAYGARHFMNKIHTQCVDPIGLEFSVDNETALWNHLAYSPFSVTCEPILTAQECATRLLSSVEYHQLLHQRHPEVIKLERTMVMLNTTVNFACRDNVELFDDHKGCLFRRGGPVRALYDRDCGTELEFQASCIPQTVLDCVTMLFGRCGEYIRGLMRTLASKMMADNGCETDNERF